MNESKNSAGKLKKRLIIAGVVIVIVAGIILANTILLITKYNKAMKLREEGRYDEAIVLFDELYDYKDSQQMVVKCNNEKIEAMYSQAEKDYENGNYHEALEAFRAYPRLHDSAEYIEKIMSNSDYIKTVNVGDTFYFGSYNDKPVEWRVVESSGASRKVVTMKLVDGHPYNTNGNYSSWEYCDLRVWLNNDFYNIAFSGEEKARIVSSKDSGCNDNLYIPSSNDVYSFFASAEERFARHHSGDGGCRWWVNNEGVLGNTVQYVDSAGELNSDGDSANCMYGIRAVMWVNLD